MFFDLTDNRYNSTFVSIFKIYKNEKIYSGSIKLKGTKNSGSLACSQKTESEIVLLIFVEHFVEVNRINTHKVKDHMEVQFYSYLVINCLWM